MKCSVRRRLVGIHLSFAIGVALALGWLTRAPLAAAEPTRIPLWNGKAPVGDGQFDKADAFLTIHSPPTPDPTAKEPAPRTEVAVVICPGGGYGGLVTGPEGHGIAKWLNSHGITGAVLEYRLPAGRSMVPLSDAQRAIRYLRQQAASLSINPAQIGIMGFSAGGHLASTAGTHFDAGKADSDDPVERQSCRPDFMILVYPVITMGETTHGGSRTNLLGKNPTPEQLLLFSNEKQVTIRTPPAFLAHAVDDKPVPIENSRAFYTALQQHKIPVRMLELPSGGHGLNGYKGPSWDAWQRKSLEWLDQMLAKK